MSTLRIALPNKGRLERPAADLLQHSGMRFEKTSRSLSVPAFQPGQTMKDGFSAAMSAIGSASGVAAFVNVICAPGPIAAATRRRIFASSPAEAAVARMTRSVPAASARRWARWTSTPSSAFYSIIPTYSYHLPFYQRVMKTVSTPVVHMQ